jgi:UDP-glucose 4-epimerase
LRYLITGGSGYLGSRLASRLAERVNTETVVNLDVVVPEYRDPRTAFRQIDVRDALAVETAIAEEAPDVLIHTAFVLDPTRDEPDSYEVNVNGTFNVLAAASLHGVPRVCVTTATMAYGARAGNPVPIEESQPVYGHAHYMYARHCAEADRIAQLWATLHRQRLMTIVRPCTIFGEGADNHLIRMWDTQSFFPDFGTGDQPTQFLHIDDAVSGYLALIDSAQQGPFNLVPDGEITWHQCAEIAGVEVRPVREQSFTGLAEGIWKLRRGGVELPPSFMDFLKHPFLASNQRIKSALPDWRPEHPSREVFDQQMRARANLHSRRGV